MRETRGKCDEGKYGGRKKVSRRQGGREAKKSSRAPDQQRQWGAARE